MPRYCGTASARLADDGVHDGKMTKADTLRQGRREGEAIRVIFVVTAASIWPSQQSVWEACRDDPRFIVRVLLVANRYNDRQSKEFHQARAMLVEADIPFTYAYKGVLDDFKPDVVFLPSPYTDMLPTHLHEDALEAHGARIAYLPYGIEIGGGAFNTRYQFNLPLHNRAWRVFARSISHRRMFARYCESGAGHVAVVGSPRLDRLAHLDACDATALEARIKGRKAILWTPHFSEGQTPAWSSFSRYCEHILDVFSRRTDTHVLILRPHPLLFPTLRRISYWTDEQAADFSRRIAEAENVILDESGAYLPAFKAADALMGDAGSFLLEFFATGKPLLYLSPKDGVGLNDDARLTDYIYVCNDSEDITAFVDAVGRGDDPMGERRRASVSEFFHVPEKGTVGQAVADHVAEAILSGDDIRTRAAPRDELHAKARAYWAANTNTYLAPPEYYDRQEEVFREILDRYGPWPSAADVGCGDGRYTLLLAGRATNVTACDISRPLLQKGFNKAAEQGIKNIVWCVEGLDDIKALSRYDLTCCSGVLSGFLDIRAYAMAISMLRAMTKPRGLLITKESLALGEQRIVKDEASGYTAMYRNNVDYVDSFVQQGFELVEKIVLSTNQETGLENAYFIFRPK